MKTCETCTYFKYCSVKYRIVATTKACSEYTTEDVYHEKSKSCDNCIYKRSFACIKWKGKRPCKDWWSDICICGKKIKQYYGYYRKHCCQACGNIHFYFDKPLGYKQCCLICGTGHLKGEGFEICNYKHLLPILIKFGFDQTSLGTLRVKQELDKVKIKLKFDYEDRKESVSFIAEKYELTEANISILLSRFNIKQRYANKEEWPLNDLADVNPSNGSTNPHGGRASTQKRELARRRKISETLRKNPNCGGYRKGSGRGNKGWYKGYFCDSSWELAFVIYCLDHKIKILRCKEQFLYSYDNRMFTYSPDFIYVANGAYVEIKGYKTDQSEAKRKQFKKHLVFIDKTKIQKYLKYAIQKYGQYTKLYDRCDGCRYIEQCNQRFVITNHTKACAWKYFDK